MPRLTIPKSSETAVLIDPQQIRDLVQLMKDHDLIEIDLRDGDQQISLKRSGPVPPPVAAAMAPPVVVAPVPVTAAPSAAEPAAADDTEGLEPIKSPMVGTLYMRPDPESEPFVAVGSEITEDTIVCVIEAMKVFNEIKAEVAGTIERILVDNETPVEYGQPLILVRPPA